MSAKVIPIKVQKPATSAVEPSVRPSVEALYHSIKQTGVISKVGQTGLSQRVYETAKRPGGILLGEAPTGTGKTIGYLVGALAAALEAGGNIVISTETVALQAQVYQKDLKRFVTTGWLKPNEVAIAKGRGRYFCPENAEALSSADYTELLQPDLLSEESNVYKLQESNGLEVIEGMLKSWAEGVWPGDIDLLKGNAPAADIWSKVQANRDNCTGKSCPKHDNCPFYMARMKFRDARVIVANHHLVLADLSLREEGQEPLFPFEKYTLILDEAHHLPDVAVGASESELRPQLLIDTLQTFEASTFVQMQMHPVMRQTLVRANLAIESLISPALRDNLIGVLRWAESKLEADQVHYRFPNKGASVSTMQNFERLHARLVAAHQVAQQLGDCLTKAQEGLEEGKSSDLVRFRIPVSGLMQLLNKAVKTVSEFLHNLDRVRCIARLKDGGHRIYTHPIEGAERLQSLLWDTNMSVILTSATLRSLGSFDAFVAQAGIPMDRLETLVVDSSFDYARHAIHMPPMQFTPNDAGYVEELVKQLTVAIREGEATLVLFTSIKTMRSVLGQLPEHLRRAVLAQYTAPIPQLIAQHKNRIDKGHGSILMGTGSFSEGLDLEGHYCTHVIITRLPFPSVGEAHEAARQEVLGKHYFAKHSLPMAGRALVQMVGRLLRRDTDWGRVTILDRRLSATRYGRELLGSLPGFMLDYTELRAPASITAIAKKG